MVKIEINDHLYNRGPGTWKLNTKLLANEEYCEKIIEAIRDQKNRCDSACKTCSDTWEIVKYECAEISQEKSRKIKCSKRELLHNLYTLKETLVNEELQYDQLINETTWAQVENKIKDLENEAVQESMFRSRCKWQKYGCKPSRYFLSLEKQNYHDKTMFSVFLNDGTICKEQSRILKEKMNFYKELYAKDPKVNFNVENKYGVFTTDAQKVMLATPLTKEEIRKALFSMQKGKVCGSDGLPVEFYVRFYEHIEELLYQTYLEMYEARIMPRTMRDGIMTLIPKKNKDGRYIKNLHPLTLLNTDFKILAKCLADRLKEALPNIVGPEQTGFMKGRHLYDNVRKTMDIIAQANLNQEKIIIMSIDYLKCFDRIEHRAIYASMEFFGIPDDFIKWIKLFFNDLRICTQNAGNISDRFSKTRGVNQGCPISPACYNVIGVVMSILIKHNPHVQGTKMGKVKTPEVITQFADDTGLYLKYCQQVLTETIKVLTYIEENTGLKVSYEKTCIYRIGSLQFSNTQLYTQKNFSWSDGSIEMLGVQISNHTSQNVSNYNACIDKNGPNSKAMVFT